MLGKRHEGTVRTYSAARGDCSHLLDGAKGRFALGFRCGGTVRAAAPDRAGRSRSPARCEGAGRAPAAARGHPSRPHRGTAGRFVLAGVTDPLAFDRWRTDRPHSFSGARVRFALDCRRGGTVRVQPAARCDLSRSAGGALGPFALECRFERALRGRPARREGTGRAASEGTKRPFATTNQPPESPQTPKQQRRDRPHATQRTNDPLITHGSKPRRARPHRYCPVPLIPGRWPSAPGPPGITAPDEPAGRPRRICSSWTRAAICWANRAVWMPWKRPSSQPTS